MYSNRSIHKTQYEYGYTWQTFEDAHQLNTFFWLMQSEFRRNRTWAIKYGEEICVIIYFLLCSCIKFIACCSHSRCASPWYCRRSLRRHHHHIYILICSSAPKRLLLLPNFSPLWSRSHRLHGLCHRLNVKSIHTHFPVIWLTYKYESSAYLRTLFVFHSQIILFSHIESATSTNTMWNGILLVLLLDAYEYSSHQELLYNLTIGSDNLLFIFPSYSLPLCSSFRFTSFPASYSW